MEKSNNRIRTALETSNLSFNENDHLSATPKLRSNKYSILNFKGLKDNSINFKKNYNKSGSSLK